MKLLIFTEGTILKTDDKQRDSAAGYEPLPGAAQKLNVWIEAGAEIEYLTSRTKFGEIKAVQDVLKENDFPGQIVHARKGEEKYHEVVEQVKPDVYIEDDYASSHGRAELGSQGLNPELGIHVIIVPEFGGLDFLPDDLELLKDFGKKEDPIEDSID